MYNFDDQSIEALFGKEDAENEKRERLKEYFFRNKAYDKLRQNLAIRILVGHKGVGKSAILKMSSLEDENANILSVWVRPDDLVRYMNFEDSNFNMMVEVWKRAILDIIFQKAIERIGISESEKQSAVVYKSIAALISSSVALVKAKLGDIADAASKTIAASFLEHQVIRIYIDDLDRGWKGRQQDIVVLSAMLNAIRDLCGEDTRLQFRIGLRTDVYYLVRTSDESTDKIESSIVWLTWTNHEILAVTAKRISSFFGDKTPEEQLLSMDQNQITSTYLARVMEPRFNGLGKWENTATHRVLTSLVRRRPRDMVKLLHAAARRAHENGHTKISNTDLRSVFEFYSNERLQDIINEFRTELPDVEALVQAMKPSVKERRASDSYLYANDKLLTKLKNITENHKFVFANGRTATPKDLAEFLYKIDFIIARRDKEDGVTIRKFFDQNRFLQSQFVDFGFKWEVHPAYRWALEPDSINDIFNNLDPES